MQTIDERTGEIYGLPAFPDNEKAPPIDGIYGGIDFGELREVAARLTADDIRQTTNLVIAEAAAIDDAKQAPAVYRVRQLLADVARMRAEYDRLKRERDNAILDLLTTEQATALQKTYDNLDAMIVPLGHAVAERIEEVKDECLALGRSVSGEGARVVYNTGRTSWDNRGLDIYSRTHPDIMKFKKMGNPYASLTLDKTE